MNPMIFYETTTDGRFIAVHIGDIESDHRAQVVADFERRFPAAQWIGDITCYVLKMGELRRLVDFAAACAQSLRAELPLDVQWRVHKKSEAIWTQEAMKKEAQKRAFAEAHGQQQGAYGQAQSQYGFWQGIYGPSFNQRGSGRTPPAPDSPYAVLRVVEGAPMEVVDAAYRALAKKHHPDKGGDAEEMKRINAAYAKLKGD